MKIFLRQQKHGSNLRELEMEEIRQSGFFDADWYLDRYPDVKSSGADPLLHFMDYGWREQRDPCSLFCTKWYAETYPDAGTEGLNPLLHYIRHGVHDGRVGRDVQSRGPSADTEFDLPLTSLDVISAKSVADLIAQAQKIKAYSDPFVAYDLLMKG